MFQGSLSLCILGFAENTWKNNRSTPKKVKKASIVSKKHQKISKPKYQPPQIKVDHTKMLPFKRLALALAISACPAVGQSSQSLVSFQVHMHLHTDSEHYAHTSPHRKHKKTMVKPSKTSNHASGNCISQDSR